MTNKKNNYKKSTFILLALIILIITINNALALQITNPKIPSEIQLGNLTQLSFNTDVPVDTYNLYLDNNLLTNSNTYDWLTTTTDLGPHTIKAEAINTTTNEKIEQEYSTLVKGESPEFTINEPSQSDYNHSDISIEVQSADAELCYYVYENTSHTLNKNNDLFTDTITAKEGVSTLIIKCTANYATSEQETIIHVDTQAPQIISANPNGNLDSNTISLKVETDEVSTCKYSEENQNFEEMNLLGEKNSVVHLTSLTLNDGDYTYYYSCKDIYGNLMSQNKKIEFSIKTLPSASIDLEGDDIKKAGTYQITISTSKKLSTEPSLKYTFQEGGESKTIALVAENNDYNSFKGYLIITDDIGEDIGEFSFKGEDENGNTGTEITSGKLFRVDTNKPEKVSSLKAELTKNNNIALDWFFEGNEAVDYYIYRSTQSGVGLTNYYKGTKNKEFTDNEVKEGESYFYKVAAVDEAGNIGELSQEAQITIRNKKPKVDSKTLLVIDDMQKQITTKLLDIKGYTKLFNSEKDLLKSTVIKKLGLIEQLDKANLELKTINSNLENLKQSQKTPEELNQELESYANKIETLNKEIIINLEIDSSVEYQEILEKPTLIGIANKFFESNPTSNKEESIQESLDMLDKLNINVKLVKATIEDSNNNKKQALLVIKKYNSQEPLSNIFLVESLSPEFSSKSKEIIFNKEPIINNNGLVQYSFTNFQDEELSYYLFTNKSLSEARESKTAIFNKKEQATINTNNNAPEENSKITGNSIGSNFISKIGTNSLFLIIGVIIIAGLLAYYFKIDSDSEPNHSIINNDLSNGANNSLAIGLANFINQQNKLQNNLQKNNIKEKRPTSILVKRLREDSLNDLIKLTKETIDSNKLFDATHFYKKACKVFEEENFATDNIRRAASLELQSIYYQLLMMKQIDESHEAILNEDHKKLEWHMNNMRRLSNRIDEQSLLAERANNHYEYFYNQLNKIKTENLGMNLER